MLTTRRLTPDDPLLRDWHEAVRDAHLADREPAWWESWEATRTYLARPADRTAYVVVAALDGDVVVGGAEVSLPLVDDTDTLSVVLGVLPEHRRRGAGDLLAAEVRAVAREHGRSIAQTEVYVPDGVAFEDWCGGAFAQRHGLGSLSAEDRLLVDLPYDPDRLERLTEAARVPEGYRVVSFTGPCPDDLAPEWARMRTQMNEDVPTGELTRTASVVDVERIRTSDVRMAEQGWTKVRSVVLTAARDGAGYTELFVSAHDPDFVLQDDTLVDRAHRGQGLGAALKAANLRQLASLGERAAGRRWLQTHTEQGNVAMQRTNERFGFRRVDVLHECEGEL
ncbi:GNAT family N-acetyltransferase [Terrabacter sp. NPDC000476]|uniref:GNAT family N-acetyltransferase n=1 Tax=Terrabacter sp. NPDC000476 TaxID=3154258 RepID=UPI00332D0655